MNIKLALWFLMFAMFASVAVLISVKRSVSDSLAALAVTTLIAANKPTKSDER